MKSFINSSSSESESESETLAHETEQKRLDATSEKKGPPRQSVFEYMYQQKVMITGSADLEEHIQSARTSTPKPLGTKKRKTFYDSSSGDEEADRGEVKTPKCLATPQNSLVVGDLLAKYSPPQSSPSSNCSDHRNRTAIDDPDIWMESPQPGQPQENHGVASRSRNQRRKSSRIDLDPSSSEGETEDVKPQLRTVAPVRELTAVLLSDEERKPTSNPLIILPQCSVNKYAAQYLKDYQIQGVQWLYKKYSSSAGCILGYVVVVCSLTMVTETTWV
jgi:SNF2 family DNA or RNA helicase